MSSIATVVAVICVAALACSFVSVIAPQGNTRRILNTVLGTFILCCMIVPIKNAIDGFKINISISQSSDDLSASADEAYNRAILTETKSRLESTMQSMLAEKGYKVNNVQITLSSYDDGGIYIANACIYISKEDEDKVQEIISLTKEKFEVTPEVIMR